jgi:cleavage and polyadenylation specificity factor subunit 3
LGIRFEALGTTAEIGDACFLLEMDGTAVMLDAGLHPRRRGLGGMPQFSSAAGREVDAILISHCHTDHLGALPAAISSFPRARVLMSAPSAILAPIMLRHSADMMARDAASGSPHPPLYNQDGVDMLSYIFQGLNPGCAFPVDGAIGHGLSVTPYDAGHILGAVGFLVESDNARVFYTGDTCGHDQEILPGAEYPEGPVDLLISECTLGADSKAERRRRGHEARRMARAICEVAAAGGSILIPAFALGRTQEMLALLDRLRTTGRIPDLEIYCAGFGTKLSDLYDRTARSTRRMDEDLRIQNIQVNPLPYGDIARGPHLRDPSLILVSSGMMAQDTLSYRLAEAMLPDPRHGIFFVGYVDPEMPGSRLLGATRHSIVHLCDAAPEIALNCRIERFHFSAHSNRRQLLNSVARLNPGTVLFTHGEPDAAAWMSQAIRHRRPDTTVIMPEQGSEIDL